MTSTNRVEPVEFSVGEGVVVRGVARWQDDARGVLLCVHDFDTDLDSLGSLPALLSHSLLSVVSIDQRGCGLSDGELGEPRELLGDLRQIIDALRVKAPRVGLLAAGRSATAAVALGEKDGVTAQALLMPELEPLCEIGDQRRYCIRLVLHSEGKRLAGTVIQAFMARLLGEQLMVSNVKLDGGVQVVETDQAILAHVRLFLDRYLLGTAKP